VKFEPRVPVESEKPRVVVDAGLAAGTYRFQLVVVNQRGQRSAPVTVDVVVERSPIRITRVTPTP
jgi:hypothetical protein